MKLILKILFAPVIAFLTILTWFTMPCLFLLDLFGKIASIISLLLSIMGIAVLIQGGPGFLTVAVFVFAYLLSPYGLVTIGTWLLAQLHNIRYYLINKIYKS